MLPKKKKASLLNTKIQSKNQPSRLITFFKQVALAKGKGTLAMITAHIGIIIFITGIILSNTFKSQFTQLMHYGSLIRIGSEYCCLRSIDHAYAPTYHSICGNLLVTKPADLASFASQPSEPFLRNLCMFPEKRFFYSNQELTTTKVAIHTNIFTDFYGLIGTGSLETGWYTTIMKLPFIFCIWLGFLLGTVGGVLALKKRLQKSKLKWV